MPDNNSTGGNIQKYFAALFAQNNITDISQMFELFHDLAKSGAFGAEAQQMVFQDLFWWSGVNGTKKVDLSLYENRERELRERIAKLEKLVNEINDEAQEDREQDQKTIESLRAQIEVLNTQLVAAASETDAARGREQHNEREAAKKLLAKINPEADVPTPEEKPVSATLEGGETADVLPASEESEGEEAKELTDPVYDNPMLGTEWDDNIPTWEELGDDENALY